MAIRGSTLRAFVTALVLVAAGMATPATAGQAAPPSPVTPAVEPPTAESAALSAAADSGVPVKVAGSQSETTQAWATPAGTLKYETYAVPHWVGTPEGGWRQIDRRLRMDDGVLAPVATLAPTRFSTGGSDPLVSLPVGTGAVSFSWPTNLPPPRLEDDTAVYPSVMDGVDLRVQAQVDGFSWVLVVKSREAASNPALDTLRFRVGATGLTVANRLDGGFAVQDNSGTTVLSAGNASMWDAAGTTAGARKALARGSDPARVLEETPDVAHRAELPTRISGSDLVIEPDTEVLRGPKAVYPVVIDPWTTIGKIRWGYANESNATRNDGVARVGEDPDGSGIGRAFFAFNLQRLAGKQIRSVKFLATMKHSYSCTASPVSLWRSADLTTAGKQSWNGPDLQKWLQQITGHAHKPSTGVGCSDDPQKDLPVEFGAAALRTDLDSNKGAANYTLALSTRQSDGGGEGNVSWWKKFDPASVKLSVEYNSPPNTPTAAQLTMTSDYTAPAQPCATGSGRPILRSKTPWMKAVLTDPDGSKGGSLSAQFTLQRWNGTAWVTVSGWPRNKSGVAPSAKAEIQITSGIATGDRLRWQVKTSDTLGGSSGLSPICEFDVDMTGPAEEPSVVSADKLYPEATPTDTVHGNMGRSGLFTLGPNAQKDVASYTYQLNSGAVYTATPSAVGGSVTVWVTPDRLADNILTVRSRDKAGNQSAARDYVFLVDEGSAPSATWNLDEGSGSTAATAATGGPALRLAGGSTWTEDLVLGTNSSTGRAHALQFNGTTGSADSTTGVLDTGKTFTVSAWVKLNRLDGTYQTILSQEGAHSSAFFLQAQPASVGKWRFVRHTSDADATGYAAAVSTSVEQLGVWTHLAGTYDAGTQQLRLYVNGKLEGSASYNPAHAWQATGPTHLARAKTASKASDFAAVTIGEAHFWDRAVDARIDLDPLVEPVNVAQWEMDDLDDEAPREVSDGSNYGRPLTLVDTASAADPTGPATRWGDGYNFSTGLLMDGQAGSAATSTRVVRTDQSFSVAAWVRRDSNTGAQAVWGQDGTVNSSAYLRYQDNYTGGAWVFGLRTKDDTTGTQVAAFQVGAAATWTHLVATYDATSGVMRIYVNGELRDDTAYRATWDSTGGFTVGRMKYSGNDINFWNGAVDRVRVWQGALSGDDITALYNEP